VIRELSEGLLAHYQGQPLIDAYAVYQLLLDQWAETMQDDVYAISADGWTAEPVRVIETDKKGKRKDKGWVCDLLPKELLARQLFADELELIEGLTSQLEEASSRLAELEEEHGGDEGAFAELEKLNKGNINARIKEIRKDPEAAEELAVLREWLELSEEEAATKKALKAAEADLDDQTYGRYVSVVVDRLQPRRVVPAGPPCSIANSRSAAMLSRAPKGGHWLQFPGIGHTSHLCRPGAVARRQPADPQRPLRRLPLPQRLPGRSR